MDVLEKDTQTDNQEQNKGGEGTAPNGTAIDYDKIQKILSGTLQAKEETVLKSYFKGQGLSQEDAEKAISEFKAKQKENTPDVSKLTADIDKAKAENNSLKMKLATMSMADELSFDVKNVDYILSAASSKIGNVLKDDGSIDNEKLKEALKKFLDDVPGFKKTTQGRGFNFDFSNNNEDKGKKDGNTKRNSRAMINEIFNV